jgi:hypothetical protein
MTGSMHVAKVDPDKRIVTAVVSVVSRGDGTPIVDHDGDVIDIDELEFAFTKAFAKGGARMGGEMHEYVGGAHVIHHMTFSSDEWAGLADLMGIPEMRGAWEIGVAKFFVEDEHLWEKVKSGALPELSIGGEAVREYCNAA